MNDGELRTLARDIAEGRVFCDRHINPESSLDLLFLIFLPLALMDDEQRDKLVAEPPGLIYEYMTKAGGRAINGYPTFMSLRTLSKDEAARLWPLHEEYRKLVEPFGETKETAP